MHKIKKGARRRFRCLSKPNQVKVQKSKGQAVSMGVESNPYLYMGFMCWNWVVCLGAVVGGMRGSHSMFHYERIRWKMALEKREALS